MSTGKGWARPKSKRKNGCLGLSPVLRHIATHGARPVKSRVMGDLERRSGLEVPDDRDGRSDDVSIWGGGSNGTPHLSFQDEGKVIISEGASRIPETQRGGNGSASAAPLSAAFAYVSNHSLVSGAQVACASTRGRDWCNTPRRPTPR